MIQIAQKNVKAPSDTEIEGLRREFQQRKCVRLPNLIEESLLTQFLKKLKNTDFEPKTEGAPGDEFGRVLFVPNTQPALFLFQLLMNNPDLFHIIQRITGCPEIGNFFGRIHRSSPGPEHQIEWHGDNSDHRLVGLSVNLSDDTFSGGSFQIRDKKSELMLKEITNTQVGDAFLFGIDPNLQHRLLPVSAGGNRTVGVGWFRSLPNRETFAKDFFVNRFVHTKA
jgi:hypothetical protein